jgi:hypothetical protein
LKAVIVYGIMDLFFLAKIQQIAKNSDAHFAEAKKFVELQNKVSEKFEKIIIVFDLTNVENDLTPLSNLKSAQTTLLGFYPHVEKKVAYSARSQGEMNIVPRSALEPKLKSMLSA